MRTDDHVPEASGKPRGTATVTAPAGVPPDGCIPFRLRIGVTGHLRLSELDELRVAVNTAIDLAAAQSGYSADQQLSTPLRLTVVSALAEGADRLIAREVLRRQGSRLVCVLPVPRSELDVYLADFGSEASREEFRQLHESAWRRIYPRPGAVPTGTTREARDAGYLWAGREVIRNSDVIIALWDGKPPRGKGGTADLIRRMREHDTRLADAQPSLDPDHDLYRGRPVSALPAAQAPLVFDTAGPLRIIVPTDGDHTPMVDDAPPYDAAAKVTREQLASDLHGLDKLNRTRFAAASWRKSAEETANDLAPAEYRQWPRLEDIFEKITPPLVRADQAAMIAHRWFMVSSYFLFSCTAAATIIAAFQAVVFPGIWELTIGEVVLLVVTVVIVAAEKRWKNHERWFAYRFLAERLRSACYLLAAGVIPQAEFDIGGTPGDPVQNGWIRRAFTAVLAEQDTSQRKHTEPLETLSSLIRVRWVARQINYFENTSRKQMRSHERVRRMLYVVLGITIAAAVVHSLRVWPSGSIPTQVLVMCAIGLPAAAGALSNVRSLREFRRHSLRYARMADVLRMYLDQFEQEADINDLRRLARNIDGVLTAEARDWLGVVAEQGLEIHG